MGNELIFASTDEAIQHLANLMAVRVKIAADPKKEKNIPPEERMKSKTPRDAYGRLKEINEKDESVHVDVISFLEDKVARDAGASLDYATLVKKGRFPKGEKAILKDAQNVYFYLKFLMSNDIPVTKTMLNAIVKNPRRAEQLAADFGLKYDKEKGEISNPASQTKLVASESTLTFDTAEGAIQYLANLTEQKVRVAM